MLRHLSDKSNPKKLSTSIGADNVFSTESKQTIRHTPKSKLVEEHSTGRDNKSKKTSESSVKEFHSSSQQKMSSLKTERPFTMEISKAKSEGVSSVTRKHNETSSGNFIHKAYNNSQPQIIITILLICVRRPLLLKN